MIGVLTAALAGAVVAALVAAVMARVHRDRIATVVAERDDAVAAATAVVEAAQRTTARLQAAFDRAPDGVVVLDRDGEVLLRNDAATRFRGARHADILAEEALTRVLERALGGEAAERELQLFGPPRQVLYVRAFPLVRGDEALGAVAFVRDVTDTRRVESVRRDFVANVSHELKTPIGALALLAETIASGADDPEMMQRLAERVVREADRLGNIVDDLLDLSLIEAQEAPTRERTPIESVVHEAVDRVRSAADVAGVPLTVVEPMADVDVVCDARQLCSAIVNLLENAVKYSDRGAPVQIEARLDAGRVAIVVSDRGIGIPTRDLERIFERFYRVDRARSRQTGGTGLGLSIVRHVVQAHGGEVSVTSTEGEGSTFTVHLPVEGRRAQLEVS